MSETYCEKKPKLVKRKTTLGPNKKRFSPCSCYNKRKGDALVMRENSIIGRIIAFCAICFAFFNPKTVTYWLGVRAESGPAWYLTTVVACGIAVFVLIDLIKKIKRRKAAE